MAGRRKAKGTGRPAPRYEEVADILRAQIVSGQTDQPVRLPPECELCEVHRVSRITIRRALDILARQGLVERTPSRGTLTVPKAIAQWRHLRQGQVIHVLTGTQLLLESSSGYYEQVFHGIGLGSRRRGYQVAVQQLTAARTTPAMDLRLPDRDSTLGVIFIGLMNEVMIRHYTDAGLPVVCVDYWTTNPQADAVVVDCYSEGQTAAEFLLRHGHSQLFFIGNRLGRHNVYERESDSELMLAGVQRAVVWAGLPTIPSERICFLGGDERDGPDAAEWFVSMRPRPTAGVIFGMSLCEQFSQSLREYGLRCPEDVSLVTKVWGDVRTEMTCLRSSACRLGEVAVEALLEQASGRRADAIRFALPSMLERGRSVRQMGMALDP